MSLVPGGRADLLRTVEQAGVDVQRFAAAALGYGESEVLVWPDEAVDEVLIRDTPDYEPLPLEPADEDLNDDQPEQRKFVETIDPEPGPFWQAERLQVIEQAADSQSKLSDQHDSAFDDEALTVDLSELEAGTVSRQIGFRPLGSQHEVLTKLRKRITTVSEGSAIDVRRVVDRVSRGEFIYELPRLGRRVWGRELTVIQDRSSRLLPYIFDQDAVYRWLCRAFPEDAITLVRVSEGTRRPVIVLPIEHYGHPYTPEPGSTVVALGDLGTLHATDRNAVNAWTQFGRSLRQHEVRTFAFVPTLKEFMPAALTDCWDVVEWQSRSTSQHADRDTGARRLLRLASLAIRLEPGLLRELRWLLPEGKADAGLEALVWQNDAIGQPHALGATFDPVAADRLQATIDDEDPDLVRQARAVIYQSHRHLPQEIRLEEVLRLGKSRQHLLEDPRLYDYAEAWVRREIDQLPADWEEAGRYSADRKWALRFTSRLPAQAWHDPRLEQKYRTLVRRASRAEPHVKPPVALQPKDLASTEPESQWHVIIQDEQLSFREKATDELAPPPDTVATLRCRSPNIKLLETEDSRSNFDINRDFWADGKPPEWASAWGIDEFGPWAEFQISKSDDKSKKPGQGSPWIESAAAIGGLTIPQRPDGIRETRPDNVTVTQRMRWVAAGTFLMGSPEDEPGRYDNEGPQHEVTISRGFWIFDSPVTQQLWGTVMGENPGRFKTDDRPVENVSWHQCQDFGERLSELMDGFESTLPTEAEWECACRAGCELTTYAGAMPNLAEAHIVLNQIAWYIGNSTYKSDFDYGLDRQRLTGLNVLENESGGKIGTHPVKQKRPNKWGLYDMLGNVLEWCADTWDERTYGRGDCRDPLSNSSDASAVRVVRGGGWSSDARYVRAAYRYWNAPENRNNLIGFRCRVLSSEPSQAAADQAGQGGSPQRAESGRSPTTEPGGDSEHATEVRLTTRFPDAGTDYELSEQSGVLLLAVTPEFAASDSDFGTTEYEIFTRIRDAEFNLVVVDLTNLDIFNSVFLALLYRIWNHVHLEGKFVVVTGNSLVNEIMHATRCDNIFTIVESLEDAERSLNTARDTSHQRQTKPAEPLEQLSAPQIVRDSSRKRLGGQRFLEVLNSIPLEDLPKPEWASDWGRDDFGLWAEFVIEETPIRGRIAGAGHGTPFLRNQGRTSVKQRLRLIPPGTFLMGSPDGDDEADGDEKPQHKVTISQAFWMFDSPCTQALWNAVTGDTPSRYKGGDRPVEQISWEDCQKFSKQLSAKFADMELSLPTEAEWEYACRAGTTETRYGEIDQVAWYSQNSSLETHFVREKLPNQWGLFDTLGNVYEWCRDVWCRDYTDESVSDPFHDGEASADRVIRGGSWGYGAGYVRAAYRVKGSPGNRSSNVSFRCRVRELRIQQAVELAAAEELRVETLESRESAGTAMALDSGPSALASPARAAWINLLNSDSDQTAIPQSPVVRIVTDVEELTLRQIQKPSWASAIGRDHFGLWCEFEIASDAWKELGVAKFDDEDQPPEPLDEPAKSVSLSLRSNVGVVTQRLRWIPPGQFMFGSPKGEPGRRDEYEFEPTQQIVESGFWMFDTPCTQELWTAVMGNNQSFFKSPTRPVETVSWNACQEFLDRLAEQCPGKGFEFELPSELEWEYACRAGTTEATYAGPMEILGERNALILDSISWYGGNCGIEFDSPFGWATTDWQENQYEFKAGGTHRVAMKRANAWGLFDTLGNVYEWCVDVWRNSDSESKEVAVPASAYRVVRGGSWDGHASYVRAAYRTVRSCGSGSGNVGFRCRVRELKPQQGGSVRGAARAERRSSKAEPGKHSAATSEAPNTDEPAKGLIGGIVDRFRGKK